MADKLKRVTLNESYYSGYVLGVCLYKLLKKKKKMRFKYPHSIMNFLKFKNKNINQ